MPGLSARPSVNESLDFRLERPNKLPNNISLGALGFLSKSFENSEFLFGNFDV